MCVCVIRSVWVWGVVCSRTGMCMVSGCMFGTVMGVWSLV